MTSPADVVEQSFVLAGRTRAVVVAVFASLAGLAVLGLAYLQWRRRRYQAEHPEAPLPPNALDRLRIWKTVLCGVALLTLPWVWVYVTFRSRRAAMLQSVL